MLLWRREVGSFAANCYLIACSETKEGIVIDPGAEAKQILKMVEDAAVTVKYIVNTHGHFDHVGANAEVRQATGAPILINEADREMSSKPPASLSVFVGKLQFVEPDRFIREGDKLTVGNLQVDVIATPGHTKGSVSLLADGKLFTGDTLFSGSVGRTDLPGGSHGELIYSIKEKLLIFPGETIVYPGHGPETTIADEKKYNPFLR
ncbi:MAG: MBL fold metallo-hydrolase [Clostridium sp.]|nr:MBL fold metallo-hydrolase [Clostridium sp.]